MSVSQVTVGQMSVGPIFVGKMSAAYGLSAESQLAKLYVGFRDLLKCIKFKITNWFVPLSFSIL